MALVWSTLHPYDPISTFVLKTQIVYVRQLVRHTSRIEAGRCRSAAKQIMELLHATACVQRHHAKLTSALSSVSHSEDREHHSRQPLRLPIGSVDRMVYRSPCR